MWKYPHKITTMPTVKSCNLDITSSNLNASLALINHNTLNRTADIPNNIIVHIHRISVTCVILVQRNAFNVFLPFPARNNEQYG